MAEARREGAREMVKSALSLLAPGVWPQTPGFESAPLRWRRRRSTSFPIGLNRGPAASPSSSSSIPPRRRRLCRPLEGVFGGRAHLPRHAFRRRRQGPFGRSGLRVTRPPGKGKSSARRGRRASPIMLRAGLHVPLSRRRNGGVQTAETPAVKETSWSSPRAEFPRSASPESPGPPRSPCSASPAPRRAIALRSVRGAGLEWKKAGSSPGPRDVLLLAARRLS